MHNSFNYISTPKGKNIFYLEFNRDSFRSIKKFLSVLKQNPINDFYIQAVELFIFLSNQDIDYELKCFSFETDIKNQETKIYIKQQGSGNYIILKYFSFDLKSQFVDMKGIHYPKKINEFILNLERFLNITINNDLRSLLREETLAGIKDLWQ